MVEQELRSDLPLLDLDRDQMKQVFYNVIKNSFEAMKRRGILRIRTDMDATHVNISFTDTGGGMSAESLSRVFEPYFTTKSSGSGLGLLIVRRIVREHGGEMAIESNEGKGLAPDDSFALSRQTRAHAGSGQAEVGGMSDQRCVCPPGTPKHVTRLRWKAGQRARAACRSSFSFIWYFGSCTCLRSAVKIFRIPI